MRFLFAGGGTGGHLLPGLLLARALREAGHEVRFLVSGRKVEDSFFENEGFDHSVLPMERRGGGAPGRFGLATKMPRAIWRARKEIRNFGAQVVVGIGGFVSLPAGIAARMSGVPLDLLEINALPGKATRALRAFSRRIYCGFPESVKRVGKKGMLTGSPLRRDLGAIGKETARKRFGLPLEGRVLLITGGSQGAATLNGLAVEALPQLEEAGISVLHVTGERDFSNLQQVYRASRIRSYVVPFLPEMSYAYAAADLALSRGGAASVAELAAAGLPSIIVPYPNHRDRHQWWNASQLGQGALVIEESEIAKSGLAALALSLLEDEEKLRAMSSAARLASTPGAIEKICESLGNP